MMKVGLGLCEVVKKYEIRCTFRDHAWYLYLNSCFCRSIRPLYHVSSFAARLSALQDRIYFRLELACILLKYFIALPGVGAALAVLRLQAERESLSAGARSQEAPASSRERGNPGPGLLALGPWPLQ